LADASAETRQAAEIVQAAAEALASEVSEAQEVARYLLAADRLATALESRQIGRERLLTASPAVIESSGNSRTLVEMIEAEPGDMATRLRIAKLLFRALVWLPDTFPLAPS
jgi:hypothetical protein